METLRNGDYSSAKNKLNEAVQLSPGSAEYWYQLGRTYEFLREKEQANKAYRKALDLSPTEYRFLEQVIKDIEIRE